MTDEQIIKALECCSKITFSCDGCPLKHLKYSECYELVIRSALDLINRQNAEIERLKDILYDADGVNLVNYWHQQCKIAENGCRNFEEENETLKAEIERLEDLNKCYYTSCQQIAKSNREIKAEAVKEFAERLKEEQEFFVNECEDFVGYVAVSRIDNLVKEMVGEKDV